ncbi:STAS domain-containing protein [Streptomyces sp. NPDC018019]|uniref:STAS domain-containing protein n=1 Tax=Streptomyces sp. NPDC018019 TaxID=3365030 RepID=UPI0037A6D8E0
MTWAVWEAVGDDASDFCQAGAFDRADARGGGYLQRWEDPGRAARPVRGRLAPHSKERISLVVVDWSAAPFLTTAGTAVLEDFRQAARDTSTPFVVVVPKGPPRKVMHMVGWDGREPLFDSVGQALLQAGGVGDFGGSREPG